MPAIETRDPLALPSTGKRYKMQLKQDNYLVDVSGHSGRYVAGDVLLVDEATAERWYDRGVADIADPDAPTAGEIRQEAKRAEFHRRARAVEGTFDAVVSRRASNRDGGEKQLMPPPMPTPSRGRRRDLGEADIARAASDEDEG